MTDGLHQTLNPLNSIDFPDRLTAMVISDTHGRLSEAAVSVLQRADLIIHAGDLDTEDILTRLLAIAPVVAVRGNMDRGQWTTHLSRTELFQIGKNRIYLLHDISALDLDPGAADIQVVIHGHTHQPMMEKQEKFLVINPGSASHPRNGFNPSAMKLSFNGSAVTPEIIFL
ncbi:MAG: metallophosphoesterase [Desulfatirhabdiaceae bacterium]